MNIKTKTLVLGVALTLAACSGSRSSAEAAVRSALKDPDSAKFGTFYYNSDTKKACLGVNAKNSMGGYTGEKQVHLTKADDGWVYGSDHEESESSCQAEYADDGRSESKALEDAADNLTGGTN